MDPVQREGILARVDGPRGEVVLRRRSEPDAPGPAVLELRVNGMFVMDTVHTGSEQLLAQRSLQGLQRPLRVLLGGLGLGFTLGALLADERVTSVVVVEIEPAVVAWVRTGLVPAAAGLLADPRVELLVGDVAPVVRSAANGSVDVVLLDVDNGPDQLVHAHNHQLYGEAFLRECARVVGPGGRLAVWSADDSPALTARLRAVAGGVAGGVEVDRVPVTLQGRASAYWVFRASIA